MSIRSQGSSQAKLAGVIVLILGLWGALVPFVGPSFGYGMGSSSSWTWTESHLTLHLAPGIAAVLGAALMLRGRLVTQVFGALLAVLSGVWFVVAPSLHPLWAGQSMSGMGGMGESALSSALSALGYHYGTGAIIAVFAAWALGSLTARRLTPAGARADTGQPDRLAEQDSARVGVRG